MAIGINQSQNVEQKKMNYENYVQLQGHYLELCQLNSDFRDYTTDRQFKFINKTLAKRYKKDCKKLVKYEKLKQKKIRKIFKRNKRKFKVVSITLAEQMFISEQKAVSKLNSEFEKVKFSKKRNRILKRLKLEPKMSTRRTVQGIQSSQIANVTKEENEDYEVRNDLNLGESLNENE